MNEAKVENLPARPKVPSFEAYLMAVYPPPEPGERDHGFFESWGYEQWLIKTYQRDIEQLRILHAHEYNMTLLAAVAMRGVEPELEESGAELVAKWARESRCPLVVAMEEWTGFVWRKVVKGLVGVALWETEEGDLFCVFPQYHITPLSEPYIGPVSRDRVRFLDGLVFESGEQVIQLSLEHIEEVEHGS